MSSWTDFTLIAIGQEAELKVETEITDDEITIRLYVGKDTQHKATLILGVDQARYLTHVIESQLQDGLF
jgi:hypothetical protein